MSCRGSHLGACACWKSETHLWSISQSWQKLIFIRQESSPPHSDYYYHFIIISTLSRFIPTNDRPLESKTNDYSSHRNEHGLLDWFSWGSIINSSLFTTANSDFRSAGTINLPTEEFFRIFHTDPACLTEAPSTKTEPRKRVLSVLLLPDDELMRWSAS